MSDQIIPFAAQPVVQPFQPATTEQPEAAAPAPATEEKGVYLPVFKQVHPSAYASEEWAVTMAPMKGVKAEPKMRGRGTNKQQVYDAAGKPVVEHKQALIEVGVPFNVEAFGNVVSPELMAEIMAGHLLKAVFADAKKAGYLDSMAPGMVFGYQELTEYYGMSPEQAAIDLMRSHYTSVKTSAQVVKASMCELPSGYDADTGYSTAFTFITSLAARGVITKIAAADLKRIEELVKARFVRVKGKRMPSSELLKKLLVALEQSTTFIFNNLRASLEAKLTSAALDQAEVEKTEHAISNIDTVLSQIEFTRCSAADLHKACLLHEKDAAAKTAKKVAASMTENVGGGDDLMDLFGI